MAIDFPCFVKRRKIEIIIINQNNSKIKGAIKITAPFI